VVAALFAGAFWLIARPEVPASALSPEAIIAPLATTTTERILADPAPPPPLPSPDPPLPESATTTTTPPKKDASSAGLSEPATTTTTEAAVTTTSGASGALDEGLAGEVFASTNGLRKGEGLDPLNRNSSLDAEAAWWAVEMAGSGELSHSDLGRLFPPWSAAAENVGMGGSAGGVFDALAASPGHLANMLGDYTDAGMAAFVDDAGSVWVVQVFTR
jgi:uncharacterized protein YkwD